MLLAEMASDPYKFVEDLLMSEPLLDRILSNIGPMTMVNNISTIVLIFTI